MYKKLLFVFGLVILTSMAAVAQTIGTPTVTNTSGSIPAGGLYCRGEQIRVAFTATLFPVGTNFNVILSDAAGTFPATPTVIGSGTSNPITATLPTTLATGAGYQVRVVSVTMVPVTSGNSAVFQVNPPAPTVATPRTYCQNEAAAPFTATGTGIKWYSAATAGSSLGGPTYTPNTTNVGATTVYASQTVNGCESPTRAAVDITVNATPTTNQVGNLSYCHTAAGAAINFSSTPTGATYTWTSSTGVGFGTSGSGNIGAFSATNTTTAPLVATVAVRPTIGSCTGPAMNFTVTVNPRPTVNAVSSPTFCGNSAGSAINFSGTVPGTTYNWTSSANAGFGTSGSGNIGGYTTINNPAATVVANVAVTPTINSCQGDSKSFSVTVNPKPTANQVGNLSYCQSAMGAAISFSSATAGTTYGWTSTANVGFGTNGTGNIPAFTATNTTTAPSVATVTVTPTATGCTGGTMSFTVTVNPTPTVNAVPNVTHCGNLAVSGINFSGPVSGTTFSWTSSANAGFGTNGSGNIGGYTTANNPTAAIVANVSVTSSANGCPGGGQNFTVTVNPTPVINALPNIAVCNTSMASAINFSSATPSTNFNWTSSANVGFGTMGAGNIAGFAGTNTTANAVIATVNVTPSTSTCTGAAVGFTVTVNPTPVANALTNLTYCGNVSAPAIAFGSTTPGATFAWTSSTNVGFGGSGSGNIGGYTTVNTPTAQTTSTVSVVPTANTCVGAARTFTITINPTPTVNAVTNATFCNTAGGGAIAFSSATPATTFAWTSSANVGFGTTGSGNIGAYTATNTGATIVASTVAITPTAGACVGPVQNFTVTVNPTPVVNNLDNLTYCGNIRAQAINFGSPTPNTAFGWSSSTDVGFGGSGNGNIAGFTTANPVASASSSTVTVTPTANGCGGPARTFSITINPTPTVNDIGNATFCGNTGGGAISFSSNTPNSTFAWNASSNAGFGTSGNGNIGAYTTVNPGDVLNTNVSVSASTSSCSGPSRTFTITVNPTPAAPGVRTPDVYCQFVASSPLSATPNGSNNLNWFDTGSNAVNGAPTPGTGTPGDFTYSVSQTNGFNCVSPRSNIIVTIKPQPAVPGIPRNNFTLCQFDPSVQLNAEGANLRWYQPNNTVVSTVPTITTERGFTGSYGVTQTVNGCESQRGNITVEIRTTPQPGVPSIPVTYCQNATPRPLASEVTGENLKFYLQPTGGNSGTISIFTQTPGSFDYYVTQTGTNGCESPRAKITLVIQPLPTATISGDASITQGQSATLKLEFSGQGPWNYTLQGGFTGIATVGQNPATIVVSPLETTVYTVTRISNNCGEGTPAGTATVNVRTATINTGNPSITTLCAGTSFEIPYFSSDFVPSNAQYRVQISKTMEDADFQTIPTEGAGSPLKATVPNATPGGAYFVRVVAVSSFTVRGRLSSVPINVRELPTATLAGPASVFENESAKITITLTGESPWKVTYRDSLAQMNTSLDLTTSPFEFTTMPGKTNTYNIVSVQNGCGAGPATSRFVLRAIPVLSVAPSVNTGGEWLKVYPMPVQATCIIEVDGTLNKPVSVVITDINGRVVSQQNFSTKESEMDLSKLDSGIYFLNAEQNGRIARRKILKIQ
jgi:Secretion system C-terminal sorting domain/Ig-like domain CHU_C associated/PKD-like domain